MPLSKSKIIQQFNRAAVNYDRFAQTQQTLSDDLVRAVDAFANPLKSTIALADLGCGTGSLLKSLDDAGYRGLIGFDVAPAMLAEAKRKCPSRVSFTCSDIESLPVVSNLFDVIVSNAAIQWCQSETVFAEIARILRPRGRAFIITFGPQTLHQWKDAFNTELSDRVHAFESVEEIEASVKAAGLGLIELETQMVEAEFDSVTAMLDSVRRIGASNAQQTSARNPISKSQYKAIKDEFQRSLEQQGKLTLTYEVIKIVAEKP